MVMFLLEKIQNHKMILMLKMKMDKENLQTVKLIREDIEDIIIMAVKDTSRKPYHSR